jgi:hypothetical protein
MMSDIIKSKDDDKTNSFDDTNDHLSLNNQTINEENIEHKNKKQKIEQKREIPMMMSLQNQKLLYTTIRHHINLLQTIAPNFFKNETLINTNTTWLNLENFIIILHMSRLDLLGKLLCIKLFDNENHPCVLLCLGKKTNPDLFIQGASSSIGQEEGFNFYSWDGTVKVFSILSKFTKGDHLWQWINHPSALHPLQESSVLFLNSITMNHMPIIIPSAPIIPSKKVGDLHQFILPQKSIGNTQNNILQEFLPPFNSNSSAMYLEFSDEEEEDICDPDTFEKRDENATESDDDT